MVSILLYSYSKQNNLSFLSQRRPRDTPNIGVPWKISRVLTSKRLETAKATDCKFGRYIFTGSIGTEAHEKFRRKGSVDVSRDCPFLQRVSIACYAERCISYSKSVRPSVRPSVSLSVTRWHCVKTTEAIIMGSSLKDSPMTLVSSCQTSPQNSKGSMGSVGAEWERGRKNRQFLANKSPYLRNGARYDHSHNDRLIGSHIRAFDWYQNHRPGRPWTTKTQSDAEKMRLLEPTAQIWMKLDPYMHAATKNKM